MTHASPPTVIVIGGPQGSGKTAVATRLARELRLPRLDPDPVQRAIKTSGAFDGQHPEAMRMGYAVLWRLAEDFVRDGLSLIIDVNMGWERSWEMVDALTTNGGRLHLLAVILKCSPEICAERIRHRHLAEPATYAPPELFEYSAAVHSFLDRLSRADVHSVDATGPLDEVYATVRDYVIAKLPI